MDQTRLLRTLRAVRRYAQEPIPLGILEDILEAARWTGSSKNTQPWQMVVVRDSAMLAELSRLGAYAGHLAGATVGVALVMDGTAPSLEFDAGRLAQAIMLAAWAHGVGSCIASLYPAVNRERVRQLLGVPADRGLQTVIALGYPASADALRLRSSPPEVRSAVAPGRRGRRDLVSWGTYGNRRP